MCKKIPNYISAFLLLLSFISNSTVSKGQDTLRVMSYNVLNYGAYPLCNPAVSNGVLHSYLSTIVQFTNPDIIGLVKTGAIQFTGANGHNAPLGFADSIVDFALNTAYPGRYAYCTLSNVSGGGGAMSVLFYNQQKLGFIKITSVYANVSDFVTYKLYYKDPNLASTHDTTYLYITLNHDKSGSDPTTRNAQIAGEMQQIQTHFSHLPNALNMGDFNLRSSSEACYQTLVSPPDTGFRFYDPPFYENLLTYPANWDNNPGPYAAYMTTSTRDVSLDQCDVTGGAKDWYDHIFMSPWIVQNANYIHYIPHSYRTIGNDGQRLGFSVLDGPANTSAPANVLNAIYRMSDKYPVMLDLAVTYNTNGISLSDPELAVKKAAISEPNVSVVNPVFAQLTIYVPNVLSGLALNIDCYDAIGRIVLKKTGNVNAGELQIPCNIPAGVYFMKIYSQTDVFWQGTILKN